jgi:thiamine-phosphate pyrophosphorylase
MRRRHPIPRTWLMTDERIGAALWRALRRLPPGSGVVVRHHGLRPADRRALLRRARRVAGPGTVVLGAAGLVGPDGTHNGSRRGRLLSRSVHSPAEARAALRAGADLVFVSPVFATRSHPGAAALGRRGLVRLVRMLPMPVIALGGMSARRFAALRGAGVHGWAGIDTWLAPGRQKRKAVPT